MAEFDRHALAVAPLIRVRLELVLRTQECDEEPAVTYEKLGFNASKAGWSPAGVGESNNVSRFSEDAMPFWQRPLQFFSGACIDVLTNEL